MLLVTDGEDPRRMMRPSHVWTDGKRMAAASSSAAVVRDTVDGAPAWDLATLMPDGAVGASASGGRAIALARTVEAV